eukprot:m.123329 g.123329  ORF g.123329 m.123329 type:complete len:55 (+) comp13751_c0_seq1:215-379(+)
MRNGSFQMKQNSQTPTINQTTHANCCLFAFLLGESIKNVDVVLDFGLVLLSNAL